MYHREEETTYDVSRDSNLGVYLHGHSPIWRWWKQLDIGQICFMAKGATKCVVEHALHEHQTRLPFIAVEIITNLWKIVHSVCVEWECGSILRHVDGNPEVLRSKELRHVRLNEILKSATHRALIREALLSRGVGRAKGKQE